MINPNAIINRQESPEAQLFLDFIAHLKKIYSEEPSISDRLIIYDYNSAIFGPKGIVEFEIPTRNIPRALMGEQEE